MFERFTDQSHRAVVLAQEEARRLNHDHVGTEHLLAGLLREERGTAAQVLASSGVTLDAVRGQIAALAGQGRSRPWQARGRSRRVGTSRSRPGPRRASSWHCGRQPGSASRSAPGICSSG
jgi:ATP-dependent Clp protease ATP-binding subunit ClpA